MLIDKGAKLEYGNEHPILTALSRGNRECFIALIDGREEVVLENFQDHSLAYHAIQYDTTLLPLLASLMKQEHEKLLAKNSQTNVAFPPADLSSRDKKKFETALKYDDIYLPYDIIRKATKQFLCPWHVLDDKLVESIIPENDISKEDHLDNTFLSTSQIMPAHSNAEQISKQINNNEINNEDIVQVNDSNSKTKSRSKSSKAAYSNNYYDNNEPETESSTHSESEDISDHLTFSALDDEDQILKTNSDPFKGRGPDWVPLAQRKKQSQASSHKSQKSSNYESDKKKKIKIEENSTENNYDELSEPTYEQSEIVRTDEAAAGDSAPDINDDKYYDDYAEYGYEEEEEEEEEESLFDE